MGEILHAGLCEQLSCPIRSVQRRNGRFAAGRQCAGITAHRFAFDFCVISGSSRKVLHCKRLRGFDNRVLVNQRTAAHLYRIQMLVVLGSVLREIIEEGAGPDSQTREIPTAYSAHIDTGVVCVISVCQLGQLPSNTAIMSALRIELLTPSTPFSQA